MTGPTVAVTHATPSAGAEPTTADREESAQLHTPANSLQDQTLAKYRAANRTAGRGCTVGGDTGPAEVVSAPRPDAMVLLLRGLPARPLAGEQAGALHVPPPGARA